MNLCVKVALVVTALCWSAIDASGAPWPVARTWNAQEEEWYSQWIEQLGRKAWRSTTAMLHDPGANNLFDPSDRRILFPADCGDFPFVLRTYYAYKRRLPMIINSVDGGNYSATPNRTISQINNITYEGNAGEFFRNLPSFVSTANFRIDPADTDTAFYPIAITRETLRPGVVFYDPNGHAAVVCKVEQDGTIRLLDAHPDQSVTRITFGAKLQWRTASHRGGFLAFRPVHYRNGTITYENRPHYLSGYSLEQFGFGNGYHLRVQLCLASEKLDPVRDLEHYIRNDTYQEVIDRVGAVDRGWEKGQHEPIPVPANIYNAIGAWEDLATPSRDIRLRLSFLEIPVRAAGYLKLAETEPARLIPRARNRQLLAQRLVQTQRQLFENLAFRYKNSLGQPVELTLADVEARLFRLSFDPNHPPELRWGATGRELRSAPRDEPRFFASYEFQQPWRNRLTKKTGAMLPTDSDNPPSPPDHAITVQMERLAPGSSTERRFRLPFFRD